MTCPGCDGKRHMLTCMCGVSQCETCVRKWHETRDHVQCMVCHATWSDKFVKANTGPSLSKYLLVTRRSEILQANEMALAPQSQHLLLAHRWVKQKRIDLKRLEHNVRLCHANLLDSRSKVRVAKRELAIGPDVVTLTLTGVRCGHEACLGMTTNGQCLVCERRTCERCLGLGEHECREADILARTAIAETTKNCPKCAVNIFKAEGCDDMWCPACHVFFDWETGRVYNRERHNPNHAERVDNHTRNPRDFPCGGYPQFDRVGDGDPTSSINNVFYQLHDDLTVTLPTAMLALEPAPRTQLEDVLLAQLMDDDLSPLQHGRALVSIQRTRAILADALECLLTLRYVTLEAFIMFKQSNDFAVLKHVRHVAEITSEHLQTLKSTAIAHVQRIVARIAVYTSIF